jgi:hypothetical protein
MLAQEILFFFLSILAQQQQQMIRLQPPAASMTTDQEMYYTDEDENEMAERLWERDYMCVRRSRLLLRELRQDNQTLVTISSQYYWIRKQNASLQLLNADRSLQYHTVTDVSRLDSDDQLCMQFHDEPVPRLLCYLAYKERLSEAIGYCRKHHRHPLELMRYDPRHKTIYFRFSQCTTRCFGDFAKGFCFVIAEWDGQRVVQWGTLDERFRRQGDGSTKTVQQKKSAATEVLEQYRQQTQPMFYHHHYGTRQQYHHFRVPLPQQHVPTNTIAVQPLYQQPLACWSLSPFQQSCRDSYEQYIDQLLQPPSDDLSWLQEV